MIPNLSDPQVVKRYDDSFATGNDRRYPTTNLVRLEISYFGHRPGQLLEYGFGSGANLIHLLECGHEIDALDTSANAKMLVEGKLSDRPDISDRVRLTNLPTDAQKLPYGDEVFDYVVCMSVLSLLASRERVACLLMEFQRVLKSKGKAILDINGPRSEYVHYGSPMGDDVYEFRGERGAADPISTYCPDTEDKFIELVRPLFEIDNVGFTEHKHFSNIEHEFIICAHKA